MKEDLKKHLEELNQAVKVERQRRRRVLSVCFVQVFLAILFFKFFIMPQPTAEKYFDLFTSIVAAIAAFMGLKLYFQIHHTIQLFKRFVVETEDVIKKVGGDD